MPRLNEILTEDNLEYRFQPNNTGYQYFRVRAPNDAHVALCTSASASNPMYEIFIGGWGNTKSVIRKNGEKPDVAEVPTPGILSENELRGFWVRWGNGNISAGYEKGGAPFIQWTDSEQIDISYIGFCTGWGATGTWMVEDPFDTSSAPAPAQALSGACGEVCWIPSSEGRNPPLAFQGGEDNGEPLFVIRAHHGGGLIPGKLVSSHGVAYVPWGGQENPCHEYEVLCDFKGTWVSCSGNNIPGSALPAGQTEDGETLFIGRVNHAGSLTVGKVHPSHGVCYIPYGGQEMGFENYEILVQ